MLEDIIQIQIKNELKEILTGEIYLYDEDIDNLENVRIELNYNNKKIKCTEENYFETLIKIRENLEKEGLQMICKGAHRKVYPSAMQLSMGNGRKAYLLELKKTAKLEDIVDIFDKTDNIEECVSVNEQKNYFEEWAKSLEE